MTDSPPASPKPIVLIHGLWLTPLSWEYWVERFEARGHQVLAPAWPGIDRPIELDRSGPVERRPARVFLRDFGIGLVDHF